VKKYNNVRTQATNEALSPAYTTSSLEIENINSDQISNTVISKGPATRIGAAPIFAIDNDDTSVTTWQTIVVYTHYLISFMSISQIFTNLHVVSVAGLMKIIMTIGASVILGDLATGIFHWSVDNYGSIRTPIFGAVCAAFQGHHSTPWTITFRPFINNVFKIAYGTIPALLLLMLSHPSPLPQLFFTLFINWWLISQEFHKYSHMHMRNIPSFVRFLQDRSIMLSRKEHGLHHNSPFEGHYCILTGICNGFLDKIQFFRHMERIVFRITGEALEMIIMMLIWYNN
jgi:ubiquitin-conjugating enzyme E2 variant